MANFTEIEREQMLAIGKAAGMVVHWFGSSNPSLAHMGAFFREDGIKTVQWNPRDDDADNFRLMVALEIDPAVEVELRCTDIEYKNDPVKATRRAIMLAAVEQVKGVYDGKS